MNPSALTTRSGHTIAATYVADITEPGARVSCPFVTGYDIPVKSCTGRILTHLEEQSRPKLCLGEPCPHYALGALHKAELLRDRRAPTTLGVCKTRKTREPEPSPEELEEIEHAQE